MLVRQDVAVLGQGECGDGVPKPFAPSAGTPFLGMRVAWTCRRSWTLSWGKPALSAIARPPLWLRVSGRTGQPRGSGKTCPGSSRAPPIWARFSRFARHFRSTLTVSLEGGPRDPRAA